MATFADRLKGRVVIVAGASTGIGRATSLRLAAEGAQVVVGAPPCEQALIDSLVEEIGRSGGQALGIAFDATDDASLSTLVEDAVARFGGIDAFHANFADLSIVAQDTDAVTVSDEIMERTIEVNLKGMLRATRHAVPRLLDRGGGAIIYTSSGAAIMGDPAMPCYAMAKSGLNALMRHVASRWGKQNVRANAILPGFVITPEKAHLVPTEVAERVLATCRSPRLGTPQDIGHCVGRGDVGVVRRRMDQRSVHHCRWGHAAQPLVIGVTAQSRARNTAHRRVEPLPTRQTHATRLASSCKAWSAFRKSRCDFLLAPFPIRLNQSDRERF